MKTASAKAKGRRLASEFKELILRYFGTKIREDDITVTPSGVTGPDLTYSPALKKIFHYVPECKNQESLQIWKALEQAEQNRGEGTPILVFRRNHSKTYVVLEVEDFFELASKGLK